jgi:hypothetical protein
MARGLIGTINDEIASGGSITGDLTVEGDLTIQGSSTSSNYDEVIDGHVQVTSTNKLKFGGSTSTDSDSYILESSADVLDVYVGAVKMLSMTEAGGGASDKVSIPALTPLYLDGGGNSYIAETAGDTVKIVTGGSNSLTVTAATTTVLGDLVISGDDLFMATNTSGAALIGDGTNFNPVVISGDVVIATNGVATIQANSVALTTDTTGNYVATITAGTNLTSSAATSGEGTTHSLSVDDAFLVNDGNDTTTGVITSAGYKLTKSDGGGDVSIEFQQAGTTTYTMGIDDAVSSGTADLFKIHSDTALADGSDFIMDKSGNVTIGGDLTVSGDDLFMGTNTSGYVLVADGTNFNPVAISGDVTLASNGAVTIASTAVEHGMLAGSIPDSKLDQITTANKVDIGALDIDGASDIGAGLADADLIIVDDNAAGAEKKCAVSRIKTYVADVTLTTGTQAALTTLAGLTTIGATSPTTTNVAGILTVGASGSGQNVTFFGGDANAIGLVWDEDGGTASNGALTLGANTHGIDFTVYGDSNLQKMVWDSSADTLTVTGTIATADLELQNDRGHYLIVEEEDYLSIKNEKTGKLYKFVLEEIDGS